MGYMKAHQWPPESCHKSLYFFGIDLFAKFCQRHMRGKSRSTWPGIGQRVFFGTEPCLLGESIQAKHSQRGKQGSKAQSKFGSRGTHENLWESGKTDLASFRPWPRNLIAFDFHNVLHQALQQRKTKKTPPFTPHKPIINHPSLPTLPPRHSPPQRSWDRVASWTTAWPQHST